MMMSTIRIGTQRSRNIEQDWCVTTAQENNQDCINKIEKTKAR